MKKILFFIFSILFYSCSAQYGAAVTHRSGTPTAVKNYAVKPSLLDYDIIEQALWVNNQEFGYYKLMSPQMRYLRGFININFGNNQIIQYSFIHSQLQSQSLSNNVLNGLYIVKFTVAGGTITDIAEVDMSSIPNLILAPSSYLISNNDFLIIRYERGILKSCQQIIDKTRFKVQQIDDSIRVHRNEIDSLKGQKITALTAVNNTYVPFLHTKCSDSVNVDPVNYFIGQYGTSKMPHFFAVPDAMEGDTLIGLQVSVCEGANVKLGLRLVRVKQDGTIQAFMPTHLSNLDAFQTSKYFSSELLFYPNNRVLQKNDRIMFFVFSFYQVDPVNPVEVKKALGMSATLVIKPKLK